MGINIKPKRDANEDDSERKKDNLPRRAEHAETHETRKEKKKALKELKGDITKEKYKEKRKKIKVETRDEHHMDHRADRRSDRRERRRNKQSEQHDEASEKRDLSEKHEKRHTEAERKKAATHEEKETRYDARHDIRHDEPLGEDEVGAQPPVEETPEKSPEGMTDDWNKEIGTWRGDRQKEDSKEWVAWKKRSEYYTHLVQSQVGADYDSLVKDVSGNKLKTLTEHHHKNKEYTAKKGDKLFGILKNFYTGEFGLDADAAKREVFMTLAHVMSVTGPESTGTIGNVDELSEGSKVTIDDGRLTILDKDGNKTMDNALMRPE